MTRTRLTWIVTMRIVLIVFAVAVVAAADPPVPPASARAAAKVKEVIGHRGSSKDRPENTLAAIRRAIEVGAHVAEIDLRTTRDGALVLSHDPDLARTTNGTGRIGDRTLAEIKLLDAGARFDPKFKGERVPTLRESLTVAKGKIGLLLDLKESGEEYATRIAAEVKEHGEPKRVVIGVRSVEHARQFRQLLPEARLIGLIPTPADVQPFADAGVRVIRLWPKWLTDTALVAKVRQLGLGLNVGAGDGTRAEVLPLLVHEPESLSSDDPGQLIRTLRELAGPGG